MKKERNVFFVILVVLTIAVALVFAVEGDVDESDNRINSNEISLAINNEISVEAQNEDYETQNIKTDEVNLENEMLVVGESIIIDQEELELVNDENQNLVNDIYVNLEGESSDEKNNPNLEDILLNVNETIQEESNEDIIIDYTLIIDVIRKPSQDTQNGILSEFEFNFSYYLPNLISCNFNITNVSGVVYNYSIFGETNYDYSSNLSFGSYTFSIYCFDKTNISNYDFKNDEFNVLAREIKQPEISFSKNKNSLVIGEEVNFIVNITTYNSENVNYFIDFDDGNKTNYSVNSNNYISNINHKYLINKSYNIKFNATINGLNNYTKSLSLIVINNTIINETYVDNEDPKIKLIVPLDEDEIESELIDFIFNPSDNIKLSNCSFNLYYYNDSENIGSLVYQEIKTNPANSQNITITLRDFDDGDYTWEVECYDNSSNLESVSRDFEYIILDGEESLKQTFEKVKLTTSSDDEISKLIEDINLFLTEEEKYDLDAKQVSESLGLTENLRFYKKKLIQIKTDIEHNLDYVSEATREKRLLEIEKEIEEIRLNIPLRLSVEGKNSFNKNSLSTDVDETLKDYLRYSNIIFSNSEIKDISNQIKLFQKDINVATNVNFVYIKYIDGREERLTVIEKKISVKGANSYDAILEVIPKEVANSAKEITFVNKISVIKDDPLILIELNDLKNGALVYSIKGNVAIKEIEKADTLLFNSEIEGLAEIRTNKITGFSVLMYSKDKGIWFYISWVIFILIVLSLFYYFISFRRLKKLGRFSEFKEIEILIKESFKAINSDNVLKAKENYQKIKALYAKSNEDLRGYYIKRIVLLQKLIDKKEISSLVKECMLALNEKRIEDAKYMYSKIKPIYQRLPRDIKEKVYEKIIPYLK